MVQSAAMRLFISAWVVVCAAWLVRGGCATFVAGAIPPSVFRFASVVPQRTGDFEPRGWKVAQVNVLLGRQSGATVVESKLEYLKSVISGPCRPNLPRSHLLTRQMVRLDSCSRGR